MNWRALREIPKWAQLAALGVALAGAAAYGVHRWIDGIRAGEAARIYAAADSAHNATADSVRRAVVHELDSIAKLAAVQDTAVQRHVAGVRKAVAKVPPKVAAVPEVAVLIKEATLLANAADSARIFHIAYTLSTARLEQLDTDYAKSLRVTIVQLRERNIELAKRPTRLRATLMAAGGFVVGLAAGVVTAVIVKP